MRLPTGPTARRSLIALITLGVILLLVATLLPLGLGASAQQAYQDLLRSTAAALPPGWVLVEHYERGWFSSRANAELTRQPLPGQTPAGVSRIRLDSRIDQGPWAWFKADLFPALTQVHTRVELLADPLKVPPLLVTTTIGADGSGLTRLLIPAADQSGAPDGYRLQSTDITGTAHYRPNPRQLAADLRIPGLALLDDTAGPVARLTDARLKADLTGWIGGLFTGRTSLEVESAEFSPPPQTAANAKPALLQRLRLTLEQVPQGQAPALRLDLRLDAAAELLRLGSVDYRSPVIGLAARSLDAQALAEINTALRTLSDDGASPAMRGLVGATLLTQLLPRFLAAGPSVTLDPFTLTTPEGPVAAHLSLGAAGQGPAATGAAVLLGALLNRGKVNWLTGLKGDGAIDLPQPIALEWLARADTAVPPSPAERLQTWIDGGWVSARDGRVTSTVRLADGQLSVNGKPVPLLKSVFGR